MNHVQGVKVISEKEVILGFFVIHIMGVDYCSKVYLYTEIDISTPIYIDYSIVSVRMHHEES